MIFFTHEASIKEAEQKRSQATATASEESAFDALDSSLVEMLDNIILLYHIAVHKQLSKVT